MLRLLTLVEKPLDRAPNQRFRHEQWAPHLARAHDIELTFAPFETPALADLMDRPGLRGRKLLYGAVATARRWMRRHDVRQYDGAVILRSASLLGGAWFERYLARHRIPFIFDFDDAIWEPAPSWTRFVWRAHARVPESCRLASAVTAGNEYLATYARRHNPAVSVVPTSIDLDRYPVQPQRPADAPFRVVWIGSRATLDYLDAVLPALEQLAERMPVTLRVVCNGPPRRASKLRVEYVPWSPHIEVGALADCDVGIMPLPDTPFARGNCGLKALQYMAVGRATVVSPVGVNRDIVRSGENGLWAGGTDEWVAQLERLARDPALRARLAEAGRRTVEAGYSGTVAAAKFAAVADQTFRAERIAVSSDAT